MCLLFIRLWTCCNTFLVFLLVKLNSIFHTGSSYICISHSCCCLFKKLSFEACFKCLAKNKNKCLAKIPISHLWRVKCIHQQECSLSCSCSATGRSGFACLIFSSAFLETVFSCWVDFRDFCDVVEWRVKWWSKQEALGGAGGRGVWKAGMREAATLWTAGVRKVDGGGKKLHGIYPHSQYLRNTSTVFWK